MISHTTLLAPLAIAGALALAAQTHAAPVWVGGDGAWEEPAKWDTGSIPIAGDQAQVSANAGTARITATTGNVPISGSLSGMRVEGAGRAVIQTGGAVSMSSTLYLGNAGGGTYELQGGTLNVGYFLDMSSWNSSNQISNFTQSGGTANIANLRMNVKGTAPKAYIEVTGGELNVTGTLTMASGGGTDIAWLTQSGGKVTVGGQLQMATAAVSGAGEVIVNLDGGEMTIKNATPLTFGGGTPNYFDFDGGKLNLKGTWNFTSLTAIANSDFRVGGVAATSWDLNFNPVTIDTVPYTQITVSTGSSPFETWANGTFDPSLTQKLPGDNQDGDSLTNLQEFAFGTQPTVSTGPIVYVSGGSVTPGTPQVFPNVPASGMYSMVFGRRADYVAAGLTYTVQFSAGLGVWVDNNDGTNPPVQVATDGTINAMSVPFVDFILTPSGMQKPTFARVKVEMAP